MCKTRFEDSTLRRHPLPDQPFLHLLAWMSFPIKELPDHGSEGRHSPGFAVVFDHAPVVQDDVRPPLPFLVLEDPQSEAAH